MLKLVPFYGSLMNRDLCEGLKSKSAHVLVYGAIEAHSMGEKGCIASDKTIAVETGLSTATVTKIISQLKSAGWIITFLSPQNKRLLIEPCVDFYIPEPALPGSKADDSALPGSNAGLYRGVNIDNSLENSKDIGKPISKKNGWDPEDERLSELLRELASVKFKYLKQRKPNASHLRSMHLLHSADGYDYATIEAAIRWIAQDDFWSGVVQTEPGLRRNFNKILISAQKWQQEKHKGKIHVV